MTTGKLIAYILAAILIVLGVLFLIAATSATTASQQRGELAVGAVMIAIGLGLIVAIRLREPKPKQEVVIKQEVDIGGDVQTEVLKCKNCGAQLDKSAISVVEGAVMVSCQYCGATYQVVEEPKW